MSQPPERRSRSQEQNNQSSITPEQLFEQATQGKDLSPGELRLLISGYNALKEAQSKHLTPSEYNSILGMIAYVAHTQNVREDRVRVVLGATYNVENIQDIPSRFYQNVIEFLVELEMFKVVN